MIDNAKYNHLNKFSSTFINLNFVVGYLLIKVKLEYT